MDSHGQEYQGPGWAWSFLVTATAGSVQEVDGGAEFQAALGVQRQVLPIRVYSRLFAVSDGTLHGSIQ